MEILSAGSFINLDNEEKIEQLVYTAQEIAETAVKTEGFTASEENNKTLALDIWQGAEYMCRDAEEVQIKNIFISNFLERMNEISGVSKPIENLSKTSKNKLETDPTDNNSKDEYLGMVQTDEIQEQEISTSEVEQDKPADIPEGVEKEEIIQSDVASTVETSEIEIPKTDKSEQVELSNGKTDSAETAQPESHQKADTKSESVGSITLPEKEPYRFEECTVTATIQLFPARVDTRKVVLSVRTHDFAPQISVREISGEVAPEQLISALNESFEKYKTDLPVKVMDKLRREKESGKKKKRKHPAQVNPGETSQADSAQDTKATETEANSDETAETAAAISQAETNMQGSLFGA